MLRKSGTNLTVGQIPLEEQLFGFNFKFTEIPVSMYMQKWIDIADDLKHR